MNCHRYSHWVLLIDLFYIHILRPKYLYFYFKKVIKSQLCCFSFLSEVGVSAEPSNFNNLYRRSNQKGTPNESDIHVSFFVSERISIRKMDKVHGVRLWRNLTTFQRSVKHNKRLDLALYVHF
jgi:hypothetical protein